MRWPIAILAVCCGMAQTPGTPAVPEKVDAGAAIVKNFNQRVADYVKLQKTIKAEMHGLKSTKSPEEIARFEHGLARRIREERRAAAPGDIFTPEIAAEFRRLIALTMQGPEAGPIRKSLLHAEPLAPRRLRVNGTYPAAVPLQSTPPSLLLNLPALPPELDYRVVGRSLVLRDTEANLIVDFIPNAIS